MTLCSTAQDLVPYSRPEMIESMLRYTETDTTWCALPPLVLFSAGLRAP